MTITLEQMYEIAGTIAPYDPNLIAYGIYRVLGQDGVEKWADSVGLREMAWCVACEWIEPVWAGACLVCGSDIESNEERTA